MRYFGSSGIRGIINEKIDPDLCMKIGKAIGSLFDEVIIGRDPRPHGFMVENAIISGILSQGCDVYKAGMVSTPTLAISARGFDCGVMITASHNPAEYNGVKLLNPDGRSFDTEQMELVEKLIDDPAEPVSWNEVGTSDTYRSSVEDHKTEIINRFGTDHDLKAVVDCANGAGCNITPFLLKDMGCNVVALNSNPDGKFPGHDPEPVEKNLQEIGGVVVDSGAELGFAHDGDADRLVAFDKDGRFLSGDKLLALFASRFNKKVVVPVNSSMVIEEIVDDVIRTKVGDVFVAQEIKEVNAQFGGEPSGTWIFPDISYAPDAIFAAAFLVDLAEKIDISEEIDRLPEYPSKKEGFYVDGKDEIMDRLTELYEEKIDHERLNFADGIRIGYEDGWAWIRASGTEPKIRLTAEAKDASSLKYIYDETKMKLKEVIG